MLIGGDHNPYYMLLDQVSNYLDLLEQFAGDMASDSDILIDFEHANANKPVKSRWLENNGILEDKIKRDYFLTTLVELNALTQIDGRFVISDVYAPEDLKVAIHARIESVKAYQNLLQAYENADIDTFAAAEAELSPIVPISRIPCRIWSSRPGCNDDPVSFFTENRVRQNVEEHFAATEPERNFKNIATSNLILLSSIIDAQLSTPLTVDSQDYSYKWIDEGWTYFTVGTYPAHDWSEFAADIYPSTKSYRVEFTNHFFELLNDNCWADGDMDRMYAWSAIYGNDCETCGDDYKNDDERKDCNDCKKGDCEKCKDDVDGEFLTPKQICHVHSYVNSKYGDRRVVYDKFSCKHHDHVHLYLRPVKLVISLDFD